MENLIECNQCKRKSCLISLSVKLSKICPCHNCVTYPICDSKKHCQDRSELLDSIKINKRTINKLAERGIKWRKI